MRLLGIFGLKSHKITSLHLSRTCKPLIWLSKLENSEILEFLNLKSTLMQLFSLHCVLFVTWKLPVSKWKERLFRVFNDLFNTWSSTILQVLKSFFSFRGNSGSRLPASPRRSPLRHGGEVDAKRAQGPQPFYGDRPRDRTHSGPGALPRSSRSDVAVLQEARPRAGSELGRHYCRAAAVRWEHGAWFMVTI